MLIDGVDIRELSFGALADAVGVVSQETYLFHASVRENLRFARPDATDEEIEEAARAAQIHDKIAELAEGYDTVVGERGFRFSGGEKQRIAIARTILRNPPVLVLDEATSALDVQTERAVELALEQLAEGRTTIVIAHRLSTVRGADQIIVLDHGEIVERGTHAELLALGGRYAEMVARDEAPVCRRKAPPRHSRRRVTRGRRQGGDDARAIGPGPVRRRRAHLRCDVTAGAARCLLDLRLVDHHGRRAGPMIVPPCAVLSPTRAAGFLPIMTFVEPMTMVSGGPTQVHMSADDGGRHLRDQHGRDARGR